MSFLSCVEIEPDAVADAAVIWLHGLGADGHDFEPIVPELRLSPEMAVRFVFPHAPARPVTINNGYVMPAWYDITGINIDEDTDVEGLKQSAESVRKLVKRERERGINSERIVLAGFSQGGAVAYQVALAYSERLAGMLALSTYLADREGLRPHPANRGLPIQIYHGTADPVVPEPLGSKSYSLLVGMGYRAEYKTYPMQHAVCADEIKDISKALRGWLS